MPAPVVRTLGLRLLAGSPVLLTLAAPLLREPTPPPAGIAMFARLEAVLVQRAPVEPRIRLRLRSSMRTSIVVAMRLTQLCLLGTAEATTVETVQRNLPMGLLRYLGVAGGQLWQEVNLAVDPVARVIESGHAEMIASTMIGGRMNIVMRGEIAATIVEAMAVVMDDAGDELAAVGARSIPGVGLSASSYLP